MRTLCLEQMEQTNGGRFAMNSSCMWGLAGCLMLCGSALASMSSPFTWWATAELTFSAAGSIAGVPQCAN